MAKLIVEISPEMHDALKKRSALMGTTIKEIVTEMVRAFLARSSAGRVRETGFCGAWEDERGAEELVQEIKARRSWFQRAA